MKARLARPTHATANAELERLAPIACLVEAARAGGADLGSLVTQTFPGLDATPDMAARMSFLGESWPAGLGAGVVAVWHDTVLFVVSSINAPTVSIDGRE